MKDFLIEVDSDPGICVVVLRGNGRHFMAGGDLQYLGKLAGETPDQRAAAAAATIQGCNELIYTMRRLHKPVVAAVQGGAPGRPSGWSEPATSWSPQTTHSSCWRTCPSVYAMTA